MEKEIIEMYKKGLPIDFIVAIMFQRLSCKYPKYSKFEFGIFGELSRSSVKKEVEKIILEYSRCNYE